MWIKKFYKKRTFTRITDIEYRTSLLDEGLTLLEVLVALVISGIFLVTSLNLLTEQWRGSKELKQHLEIQYAVTTAGDKVVDAIRSAQKVEWSPPGTLKVLPWPDSGNLTEDYYYIADKDYDGVKDLYCVHLNEPNPIASRITFWECQEVEPGLWKVYLEASISGQKVRWSTLVRQRSYRAQT